MGGANAPANSNPTRPAIHFSCNDCFGPLMTTPSLDDLDLAYETGVHLGDGCLSEGRYVISGNRQNETCYYKDVLSPLIEDLYSLSPTIAFQNNSVYLRVYSKELVDFKHFELGLPIGKKRGLQIPPPLNTGKRVVGNVVSGLYDTDGSVKIRHDKSGDYPRISLGQKHKGLVGEVKSILENSGITSTMYRNDYFDPRNGKFETRWFLDVNGFQNFERFVSRIGTRSPYVLERIAEVRAIA